MKIINFNGDRINACFTFKRGGCEISVSTIFNKNRAEIAVFCGDELIIRKLPDIPSAINFADKFEPKG